MRSTTRLKKRIHAPRIIALPGMLDALGGQRRRRAAAP